MFIVVKHRYIAVALFVLIMLQLVVMSLLCVEIFEDKGATLVDFTVVIDAGHGGIDGGVTANGIKESDLNLDYAKCLGEHFEMAGFNVVYTRKTKDGLYGLPTAGFKLRDMLRRKQLIEAAQPNIVVSVHMNKFSQTTRSGPQVFFQQGNLQGKLLAENLQQALNNFTGNQHQAIGGDYFICRESPCAAVIVECGFLSNLQDAQQLQTQQYKQDLCSRIFDGVMLYLYSA